MQQAYIDLVKNLEVYRPFLPQFLVPADKEGARPTSAPQLSVGVGSKSVSLVPVNIRGYHRREFDTPTEE
eukprot:gene27929-32798_t